MATIHQARHPLSSKGQRTSMTENLLYGSDLISTKSLTLPQIQQILTSAAHLKAHPQQHLLENQIIAHCFFEPSTRTRLSFETATLRLGGKVIGFSSDESLSIKKGETLYDTMQIISNYADLIIVRHRQEGAAQLAADVSSKPVINAGDGANQHPTQALVDLFSMYECRQKLDGLALALIGDLKYSRTIHSLVDVCSLFDIRLFLVAPDELTMPETICDGLKKKGLRFSFHHSIDEVISKVDFIYMTRIQQERLVHAEHQLLEKQYILTPDNLIHAKPDLKVLCPMPRINEIDIKVDATPFAYYFQQAANGVFVRQALLSLLLNKTLPQ
jgi:aspartate carbamoyltransferase catalytic subunit